MVRSPPFTMCRVYFSSLYYTDEHVLCSKFVPPYYLHPQYPYSGVYTQSQRPDLGWNFPDSPLPLETS